MSLGSEILSVDGRCFGTELSSNWTRDISRSGRIEQTERMDGGSAFEPSTVLSRWRDIRFMESLDGQLRRHRPKNDPSVQ